MEYKLLHAGRFVDTVTGCSYRYVNSKTEYFRPHTHDYYEIFIMIDGAAYHTVNGTEVLLTSDNAVLVRATDRHQYRHADSSPFEFLNITFTAETLTEAISYLGDGYDADRLLGAVLSPTVKISKVQRDIINAYMESARAVAPDDHERRKTAIRVLIMYLLTDVFATFEPEERIPEWLASTCDRMKLRDNFPEGLVRMVEISGRSREHLTRSMRKYLHKSPTEYINELRLNYIANMLTNSNHKILEIIYDAGFNSTSRATTLFRSRYGVSMSEYRHG